jgi:hypothetical protein
MNSFIKNLSPKEWEHFCEVMLRQEFGTKNFYSVPDEDNGDYGLEFYTVEGTIYQCYRPDDDKSMAEYKKCIQRKINSDLKKLQTYEKEIQTILDDIVIDQWVLLTPKNISKQFLSYCNKKKKEIIEKKLSYINNTTFSVKIETASSFPESMRFAQEISNKVIDIPLLEVSKKYKNTWENSNSDFAKNIKRKSSALRITNIESFQDQIIVKYIRIQDFFNQLREMNPPIFSQLEDSGRALLESMQENSALENDFNKDFIKQILNNNEEAFKKFTQYMSDKNIQSLSFGHLAIWLAECNMDFLHEQ